MEHPCPVRACVQRYVLPAAVLGSRELARCRSPDGPPAVTDHVAFNAAVSIIGPPTAASYSGEANDELHFTQMTWGWPCRTFVSASAGMCVLAAPSEVWPARASTLGNLGRPRPHRKLCFRCRS